MSHVAAIVLAVSLSAMSLTSVARAQSTVAAPMAVIHWPSVSEIAEHMAPPAVTWNDPAAPSSEPKPAARLRGSRSRGKIAMGIGLIGGGLAFMIANPDLTQQRILTSRGEVYKQGYSARLAGGIMAAGGGALLWSGLRRQ
jgi:hypothetical protein